MYALEDIVHSKKKKNVFDKIMPKWQGHLCFHVYNPVRLVKYGIMIQLVCKSASGYMCTMQIYGGISVPLQDSAVNLLKSYEGKEFHTDVHNLFICKMLTQAFI